MKDRSIPGLVHGYRNPIFAPPWPLEIVALVALAVTAPLFETPKAILAGFVILGWLLRYALLERSMRPMVPLDWAGLSRFVAIVISAFYGIYLLDDWGRLADANHDLLLVAFLVLLPRAGHSDLIARVILATLVIGSVLGLASLLVIPDQLSASASAILAMRNANVTGFYLALTSAVTLAFLIQSVRWRQWVWVSIVTLVLIAHYAGIAFTGSRAGAGMAVVGAVVLLVLGFGWRRAIPFFVLIFLIATAAALMFDSRLAGRLSEGLGDNFLSDRHHIWSCGWNAFLQSPLLGYGPDNFDPVSRGVLGAIDGCQFSSDQAHNLMLNVLVDTGLIGTAAFIWLVVEVVRRLWSARAIDGRSFVVWASGVAVLVQVGLGGLVDNVVSNAPNYAFGLIVGLAIAEPVPRWTRTLSNRSSLDGKP